MSREIDERIVKMQFDNNQFEGAAKTTLSTLDKLKEKLNFTGAVKGADQISSSMNGIDFSSLSANIDSIAKHFSAFGIIGDQILRNIANSITNIGYQFTNTVKSMSVDQISAGFGKFDELTRNTATLMAQNKWSLETVEGQLERLNWFTDETSYNFTDMVSNIGKFTASGKGLEESVTAMEGIANWAALSGQNAATASRAMYQLSQAMGAGTMRLQDYRSIQNAAMDTEEFRQKALDAGVALGTLKKNADGTYTSIVKGASSSTFKIEQFADHLTQEQWFNSDVMMKVFQDYSTAVDQLYEYAEEHGVTASEAMEALGDNVDAFGLKAFKAAQEARSWGDVIDSVKDAVSTGWMTSFKLIFGNYKEATALWTGLANRMYDIFMDGTEARNEMLLAWKDAGGRDALTDTFFKSLDGLLDMIHLVKEAFSDIFPPITGERIADVTKKIQGFINTITGHKFDDISERLSDGLINLGDNSLIEYANKFEDVMDRIKRSLKGVFALVDIGKQLISSVFTTFIKPIIGELPGIGDGLLDITANIGDWLVSLDEAIKKGGFFTAAMKQIGDIIKPVANTIRSALDWIIGGLTNLTNGSGSSFIDTTKVMEKLQKVFSILQHPIKAFSTAITWLFNTLKQAWPKVKPIVDSLQATFGNFFKNLSESMQKGDFSTVIQLINGFFTGSILKNVASFTGGLTEVSDGVSSFIGKFAKDKGVSGEVADTMFTIAKAIAVMAASMYVLSLIDTNSALNSIIMIEVITHILEKVAKTVSELNAKSAGLKEKAGIAMFGVMLMSISAALLIMAGAVKLLSSIDTNSMFVGILGIGLLLAELSIAMKHLTSNKLADRKVISGLVGLAASLLILSVAVKKLGEIDGEAMARGLTGVAVILAEMASFTKLSGKIGVFDGIGYIEFALSLMLIAKTVQKLGEMDMHILEVGLSMMFVLLTELVIFSKLSSGIKAVASGAGLLIMSAALVVLAGVIKVLGAMDLENIGNALVALGVSLMSLAIASGLMSVSGAAGLLIAAAAIAILAPAFALLSAIPLENIGAAIIAIAGSLLILGLASAALAGLIVPLLGVAAALALFGVAAVTIGLGISSIATSLPVAVGSIVATIGILVSAFINGAKMLISAIPEIAVLLMQAIVDIAGPLAYAVFQVIFILMNAVATYCPMIASAIILFITRTLIVIRDYIPDLVQAGIDLMIGFIDGLGRGIVENTDKIMQAVGNLITGIIYFALSMLQTAVAEIPLIGDKLSAGIDTVKENLKANMSPVEFQDASREAFGGIATGAEEAEKPTKTSVEGVIMGALDSVKDALPGFKDGGYDSVVEYAKAMKEKTSEATGAASDVATDASDKFSKLSYDGGKEGGYQLNQGAAKGMDDNTYIAVEAAERLGGAVTSAYKSKLSINSPSKVFEDLSAYIPKGAAKGILGATHIAVDAVKGMATEILSPMSGIMGDIQAVLDSDFELNPTIRPVLDMSGINGGLSQINAITDSESALSLAIRSNNERIAAQQKLAEEAEAPNRLADRIVSGVVSGLSTIMGDNGDISVSVYLEPDAAGIFRVVRTEANRFTRATGYSPFNNGK